MKQPTALCVATALACMTMTTACHSLQSGAEDAVRQSLKDPDSARFGAFYYNEKNGKGCLAVNAKNSMGGYTGDQQAYVKHNANGWEVDGIADLDQQSCRDVFADRAD